MATLRCRSDWLPATLRAGNLILVCVSVCVCVSVLHSLVIFIISSLRRKMASPSRVSKMAAFGGSKVAMRTPRKWSVSGKFSSFFWGGLFAAFVAGPNIKKVGDKIQATR